MRIHGNASHCRSDEGAFHVHTFSIEGRCVVGGQGSAVPLQYVRNAHSGRATAQAPEYIALLQEYRDAAKMEGFGGHKLVRGDEVQFDGEEGEEKIKGVALFKYLVWPLEQSEYDWLAVRQNIGRARRVWSRLGVILRREGADLFTLAVLYRAVVQAVILFESEKWLLL